VNLTNVVGWHRPAMHSQSLHAPHASGPGNHEIHRRPWTRKKRRAVQTQCRPKAKQGRGRGDQQGCPTPGDVIDRCVRPEVHVGEQSPPRRSGEFSPRDQTSCDRLRSQKGPDRQYPGACGRRSTRHGVRIAVSPQRRIPQRRALWIKSRQSSILPGGTAVDIARSSDPDLMYGRPGRRHPTLRDIAGRRRRLVCWLHPQ
jgi:hypothetical protein